MALDLAKQETLHVRQSDFPERQEPSPRQANQDNSRPKEKKEKPTRAFAVPRARPLSPFLFRLSRSDDASAAAISA